MKSCKRSGGHNGWMHPVQADVVFGPEHNDPSAPPALAGKNVLVIGLGRSGYSAAKLALTHAAKVTVLDAHTDVAIEQRAERISRRGADVHLQWPDANWTGKADLVILSPGIPASRWLDKVLAATACPVLGELEFGYRFCVCPIIAITGTNGKTTTTELLLHCMRGVNLKVMAAGNIGMPVSEVANLTPALDYLIVEVSSFQLERTQQFTPYAAAILNVSEDHLDRYASYEAYRQAKFRIFENIKHHENVVVNSNLATAYSAHIKNTLRAQDPVYFCTSGATNGARYFATSDNIMVCNGDAHDRLVALDTLQLAGRHNVENILAVIGLCAAAGIRPQEIVPFLQTFSARNHRQEVVARKNGICFINDSKATNPDALRQALATWGSPARGSTPGPRVHLIAGGRNKGMSFRSLVPELRQYVKSAHLIGEAKDDLENAWNGLVPCKRYDNLEAVITAIMDIAESGDVVMLSPACASQDMFLDYRDRGNIFSKFVKRSLRI